MSHSFVHVSALPTKDRRGRRIPLELTLPATVSYPMWVQGTEPGSPAGAVGTLNCSAIFLALLSHLFFGGKPEDGVPSPFSSKQKKRFRSLSYVRRKMEN